MIFDAEYLQLKRVEQGLTRRQLATKSGVSARTIRRLENGPGGDPKIPTVIGLAKALNVRTDDLFIER